MFYSYCKIGDGDFAIEVTHSNMVNECVKCILNSLIIYIYCFKEMDCIIPLYRISGIVGFSETEVVELVAFCKNNAGSILTYSKCGGIANA